MKKSIIAGASVVALAGAVMPMAGVFAADITEITDTIRLTVEATCSFNTNGGASASPITYAATVANGEEAAFTSATHKFNVTCNDNDGWKVTATPTALTGTAVSANTIPFVVSANYVTTGKTGNWSADIEAGSGGATVAPFGTNATIVATKTSSTDNADFTVTYKAYVGTETPADTYTGTMYYLLQQL